MVFDIKTNKPKEIYISNLILFIISVMNFDKNALLVEMLGDISYMKSDINKAKIYYESCLRLDITPNNRKSIENKLNSIQ